MQHGGCCLCVCAFLCVFGSVSVYIQGIDMEGRNGLRALQRVAVCCSAHTTPSLSVP